MVIAEIKPGDILAGCRQTLSLPENRQEPIDEILLAALLRRSAEIHCPCSRLTLRASLLESLKYLSQDEMVLSERIDSIIEGLIVGGDLLELNDVATDDPEAKGTWVFAAPPSFVIRPSRSIFLLGIVPDQDAFLPQTLAERISHEGFTRTIIQQPDEDLTDDLREHGMQELSESTWLKCPTAEQPEAMLNRYERQLGLQPLSGAIDNLRILDPTKSITYYPGRWTAPQSQTGTFIARRPQEFGAPLWCFVELEAGSVVRILDLPSSENSVARLRRCMASANGNRLLPPDASALSASGCRQRGSSRLFFAFATMGTTAADDPGASFQSRAKPDVLLYPSTGGRKGRAFPSGMVMAIPHKIGKGNAMQTIQETIKQLHDALSDYIEATYHISARSLIAQRKILLDKPTVIHQIPYLESTPRYETG